MISSRTNPLIIWLIQRALRVALAAPVLAVPVAILAVETVNLSVVHRIKEEAFLHSEVMDDVFFLTDVHGPRLTGSPGYAGAADWAAMRLKKYGLNVHQEKWGPFGRGWRNTHFEAHLLEPQYAPMIGTALAWTASTPGTIAGEPLLALMSGENDFPKFHGKLKGKIVLLEAARNLAMGKPPGLRLTDLELADETVAEMPGGPEGEPQAVEERRKGIDKFLDFENKVAAFLKEEGVALVLQMGYSGDGGTVFAASGGGYSLKKPLGLPAAAITPEHYNRITRLLAHNIPVKLSFNIQNEITEDALESVNVIGEIPGHAKKNEVVIIGAHLDSWQGGTGATDNAAGVAAMIEAMRVLKALNLDMDRTVRIALWGGEEEGLLGSRAYVKDHFGIRDTMTLRLEHPLLTAYFNLDKGAGKIRGIYLQGNDELRPVFEEWIKPFHDLGVTTVTIRRAGGSDHLSFDELGLPAFPFIQDPLEYASRTHHSNMDVYDRIQPGDLMQMSAVVASFAYDAAMRPDVLPRTPLPKAREQTKR